MLSLKSKIYFKIPSHLLILLMLNIITAPLSRAATRPIDSEAVTIHQKTIYPNPQGEYNFEFQTSNGITTKGAGNLYGSVGVVQYVSLEGLPITWTYTADSDGYHPDGEHIPTVPDYITRSLEYIRAHPTMNTKKSENVP